MKWEFYLTWKILAFKSSLILANIIGIASFNMKISLDSPQNSNTLIINFMHSKYQWIYNFILIIILLIAIPVHYESYFNRNERVLIPTIVSIVGVAGNICGVVIVAYIGLYQRTHVKIINQWVQIYRKQSIEFSKIYDTNRMTLYATSFQILLWFSASSLLILHDTNNIARNFLVLFPTLIISLNLLLHYAIILIIIKNQFEVLTCRISSIKIQSVKSDHHLDLRSQQIVNPQYSIIRDKMIIVMVREAWNDLCNISSEISSFYTPPVITAFFRIFCSVVTSIYIFILLLSSISDGEVLRDVVITPFVWSLVNVIVLIAVSSCAQQITNEVNKMMAIIAELQIQYKDFGDINLLLRDFSVELFLSKPSFISYKCFPIDARFIHLFFSVLITYQCILLQFLPAK